MGNCKRGNAQFEGNRSESRRKFCGRLRRALAANERVFDQVVIDFQRVGGEDGRVLLQQFERDRSFHPPDIARWRTAARMVSTRGRLLDP